MNNIETFISEDGSIGLFNKDLNEIYHSRQGAQKESIEKFILPSNFKERTQKQDKLRLLDICYGIGYNSKNALSFYKNCDILIDALEWDKNLVEMSKTSAFYMEEINQFLRGEISLGASKINFFIEDARITIKKLKESYDVIFLDAFAPNKLPTLWSVEFFVELKRLLKQNGVLCTYCSAQPVRKAMDLAGFKLGKILDEKGHSCATVCALDENQIGLKLDEYDIGLMNTKAGIPYRDKNLNASAQEIFDIRKNEFENSKLISSSQFLKLNK